MMQALEEAAKSTGAASVVRLQIIIRPAGPINGDVARRYEDLGVDRWPGTGPVRCNGLSRQGGRRRDSPVPFGSASRDRAAARPFRPERGGLVRLAKVPSGESRVPRPPRLQRRRRRLAYPAQPVQGSESLRGAFGLMHRVSISPRPRAPPTTAPTVRSPPAERGIRISPINRNCPCIQGLLALPLSASNSSSSPSDCRPGAHLCYPGSDPARSETVADRSEGGCPCGERALPAAAPCASRLSGSINRKLQRTRSAP